MFIGLEGGHVFLQSCREIQVAACSSKLLQTITQWSLMKRATTKEIWLTFRKDGRSIPSFDDARKKWALPHSATQRSPWQTYRNFLARGHRGSVSSELWLRVGNTRKTPLEWTSGLLGSSYRSLPNSHRSLPSSYRSLPNLLSLSIWPSN